MSEIENEIGIEQHSILLIGCGNMGFALLKAWVNAYPAMEFHVVDHHKHSLQAKIKGMNIHFYEKLNALPEHISPDMVILALKPQMILPLLQECRPFALKNAAFISVAAGVKLDAMADALPPKTPLIRCMPNTPSAIGHGMMVLCKGAYVNDDMAERVSALLAASGAVAWIEDEKQMDAVTAISGSGPAYIFLFIEALAKAGQALGLDEETSLLLAKQTAMGAGIMASQSIEQPASLRENVTSPNGTTAAALAIFMEDKRLETLVQQATYAAQQRSIELGS